jgi:hypothetical protein
VFLDQDIGTAEKIIIKRIVKEEVVNRGEGIIVREL